MKAMRITSLTLVLMLIPGGACLAGGTITLDLPGVPQDIPSTGQIVLSQATSAAPPGCVVTRVDYEIIVDDRGLSLNFWCSDYVIGVSSDAHGGWGVPYIVWNNAGGQTDGNADDDAPNDSDIDLSRSTTVFNGENPNQVWYIIIDDTVDDGWLTPGLGRVTHARLKISYDCAFDLKGCPSGSGSFSPSTVYAGEYFQANFPITNGGVSTTGPFTVRFYASTDTSITSSDYLIGEYRKTGGLSGGGTCISFGGAWWFPTSIPVGSYYVGCILDADNEVAECDEGNNILYIASPQLTVSIQMVLVPDVVGAAQAAAESAITSAGLVVGTETSQCSNTVAAGHVISQSPAGGTSAPYGSAVDLVISSGVCSVTVPNVVGAAQAAAESAITSAGLVVGTETTQCSNTVAAGHVISQSPAGGTSAPYGSAVDLVISSGVCSVTVPNVVGAAQAVAESAITSAGLIVGTETSQCSNTVAAGHVISQSPTGGTSASYGSAVNLVISSGVCSVTVPNVVGAAQAAAESAITSAGLIVGTETSQCSNTVAAGHVISQSPTGGTSAPPGSVVNLVVSSGPCGTQVTVPNVVGMTESQAASAITSAGLVVGAENSHCSNTVPTGKVISQSPTGGTSASPGSAVNLVLSSGPCTVTVPNVVGRTESIARSLVMNAGLVVGSVTQAASNTVPKGSVTSQNPAAGTSVPGGSFVDLVVSSGPSGPAQVQVPNVVGMPQAAAQSAITTAGLVVGTVTQSASDTVEKGNVISQTPAAGTSVASGSAVNLVISSGPAGEATPGLVAYWKLDETSGVVAYDSAGNNDGTLSGGPQWVAGKIGGALQFDGVDDYVDCGNDPSLNVTAAITVAAWVKTATCGIDQHNTFMISRGGWNYMLQQAVTQPGTYLMEVQFVIHDGGWYAAGFPVTSSFNDNWHHLAGTYDGRQVRLYVDGQLEATTDHVGDIDSSADNVNIGRISDWPEILFTGTIDDARIYNCALTATEIAQLAGAAGDVANIIWVSDGHQTIAGAATPDDQGWVDLLQSEGYEVDYQPPTAPESGYWQILDTAKLASLDAADLIIVSLDTRTTSYNDGAEITQWNDLKTPLILLGAHLAHSYAWLWVNSTRTVVQQADHNKAKAIDPLHPVFDGVTLDDDGQVVWLDPAVAPGLFSCVSTASAGNGHVIARLPDNNYVLIAEWTAGVPFYSGSPQTPGGHRMLFSAGTHPAPGTDIGYGVYDLTPEGEMMFLNAVAYMIGETDISPGGAYEVAWIYQLGTSSDDTSQGVSADGQGSVYVTGYTKGSLSETNAGDLDAFVSRLDSTGNLLWTHQLGTSASDIGSGVYADGMGNVYITGNTKGSLGGPNAGENDAIVSKFDAQGNLSWTHQLGSSDIDICRRISADGLGNVYIAGLTKGSLSGPNAGDYDAFLMNFDSAGNLLWTRQFGTSGSEQVFGVSADGLGSVYMSGWTNGSLSGPNAGDYDAFLTKLDSAGNLLWTRQLGTSAFDSAGGVYADGQANVYICGSTAGNLGGPNAGSHDGFVSRFDSAGNHMWTRQFGTSDYDTCGGISVDGLGNVYITGTTRGSLGGPNAGDVDVYVSKFDSAWDCLWTRQFGTNGNDQVLGVSADGLGSVYVSGYTYGSLGSPNAGGCDAFVAKLVPGSGSQPEHTEGLVAWWKLDEGTGTIAYDSSDYGNDGVLLGGVQWTAGNIGGALWFDGVDDYVDCGNGPSFDITEQITVAAWVKTADCASSQWNRWMISKGGFSYMLQQAVQESSTHLVEFCIYDGAWYAAGLPVTSSFDGQWYHLAGTYDGVQLKLYVDGQLEATSDHMGAINSSTSHVNIGRNADWPEHLFTGTIDDVRIYNKALAQGKIMALAETTGIDPNHVGW